MVLSVLHFGPLSVCQQAWSGHAQAVTWKPTFCLQEVVGAPVGAVAGLLPLLVHVQHGEVVRLGHEELLARGVALLGAVRRPEERAGHAEHADDDEHLIRAAQLGPHQQHLRQRGVQRKLHHLAPCTAHADDWYAVL